jgi:hypothetical protein
MGFNQLGLPELWERQPLTERVSCWRSPSSYLNKKQVTVIILARDSHFKVANSFYTLSVDSALKNEANQSIIALLPRRVSMTVEIPESVQFLHKAEAGLGAWAWGDRIVWN